MNFTPMKNTLYFLRQGMKIDPKYNFEMSAKQIAIVIGCKIVWYSIIAIGGYYLCKLIFG